MRKILVGLVLVAAALGGSVRVALAEIGTSDAVPAATLLLPYFEVDLGDRNGVNTLFSINNASASAGVAHVTLWTDLAIPTFTFDVYLTGYDVQTISMRDVLRGRLPRTADDGADPDDTSDPQDGTSNQGIASQDINFPGDVGPCGTVDTVYGDPDPVLQEEIRQVRRAHLGRSSDLFEGLCGGANYGDRIARGYVTVDSVSQCSVDFPSTSGYFSDIADFRNILWGDYFYVNPAQNFAQGDTLVHIEACQPGDGYIGQVGNGAGHCPFVPGDYTFYGRYVSATADDQREPLATTFGSRYATGGKASRRTDLVVWRDTKLTPSGMNGPRPCGSFPDWYPLDQADVAGFNPAEDVTDLCFLEDNVGPPIGGSLPCFALATQRIDVEGGSPFSEDLAVPYSAGWLYLNLNHSVIGDPFPAVAQGWVTTILFSQGRFSGGYGAVQFDNAVATNPGGQVVFP